MNIKKLGLITLTIIPLSTIVSCANKPSNENKTEEFSNLEKQYIAFLEKYDDLLVSSKQKNTLDSFVSTSTSTPVKHSALVSSFGLEQYKDDVSKINVTDLNITYKLLAGKANEFGEKVYKVQVIMSNGEKVYSKYSFEIRSISSTEISINSTIGRINNRLNTTTTLVSSKTANDVGEIKGLDSYIESTKTEPIKYGNNAVILMRELGLTITKIGSQSYDGAEITATIERDEINSNQDSLNRKWYIVNLLVQKKYIHKAEGKDDVVFTFSKVLSFPLIEYTEAEFNKCRVDFEKFRLETLISNMRPNYDSGVKLPVPSEIDVHTLETLGLRNVLNGTGGITEGVDVTVKVNDKDDVNGIIHLTFEIKAGNYVETLQKSVSNYQTTTGRINWEITESRNIFIRTITEGKILRPSIHSSQITENNVLKEEYKTGTIDDLKYRFNISELTTELLDKLTELGTTITYNVTNTNVSPKPNGLKIKIEMTYEKEGGTRTTSNFFVETNDYSQSFV